MYSGKKLKDLLDASPYSGSDLAEFLYNDRGRSLASITSDAANPTAKVLDKVANFLHVSVEEFFEREDGFEFSKSNEQLTQQLWKTQIEAKDVEITGLKEQLETLKKLVASQEREMELMRAGAQEKKGKKAARKVCQ